MSSIFSSCKEDLDCSIAIAYYEVYLDRCYDLLEPKANEIMVLEDKDGLVQMKGLSKVFISPVTAKVVHLSLVTRFQLFWRVTGESFLYGGVLSNFQFGSPAQEKRSYRAQ